MSTMPKGSVTGSDAPLQSSKTSGWQEAIDSIPRVHTLGSQKPVRYTLLTVTFPPGSRAYIFRWPRSNYLRGWITMRGKRVSIVQTGARGCHGAWEVRSLGRKPTTIGRILWFNRREYAFVPEPGTYFGPIELGTVLRFIRRRMAELRSPKRRDRAR